MDDGRALQGTRIRELFQELIESNIIGRLVSLSIFIYFHNKTYTYNS